LPVKLDREKLAVFAQTVKGVVGVGAAVVDKSQA
jgi:hypothetical protein